MKGVWPGLDAGSPLGIYLYEGTARKRFGSGAVGVGNVLPRGRWIRRAQALRGSIRSKRVGVAGQAGPPGTAEVAQLYPGLYPGEHDLGVVVAQSERSVASTSPFSGSVNSALPLNIARSPLIHGLVALHWGHEVAERTQERIELLRFFKLGGEFFRTHRVAVRLAREATTGIKSSITILNECLERSAV